MTTTGPAGVDPSTVAAQMAVETDRELRLKFPSDQAALAYLGGLLAAVSAIYERDLGETTLEQFRAMTRFNPSQDWEPVVVP